MANKLVSVAIVLVAAVLAGCTSSKMTVIPETETSVQPGSGNALVVFMRPSFLGAAIQSSVFDITDGHPEFVGIVSAGTRIAHKSQFGMRRFMVIGESADFMDAELLEKKVYYVKVDPRFGWWKARFSLIPYHKQELQKPSFAEICNDCGWLQNTEQSRAWAQGHMHSIQSKMVEYLPEWSESTDKQMLLADDHL